MPEGFPGNKFKYRCSKCPIEVVHSRCTHLLVFSLHIFPFSPTLLFNPTHSPKVLPLSQSFQLSFPTAPSLSHTLPTGLFPITYFYLLDSFPPVLPSILAPPIRGCKERKQRKEDGGIEERSMRQMGCPCSFLVSV